MNKDREIVVGLPDRLELSVSPHYIPNLEFRAGHGVMTSTGDRVELLWLHIQYQIRTSRLRFPGGF